MTGCRHLLLAGLILIAPGCRLSEIALWRPAGAPAAACAVERFHGIAYWSGPGADERRHRLDLFVPRGKKGCPVVVLVHGGVWAVGDNRCFGLYSSVGEFLARSGIVAVLPSYRLSPGVKHPEHVRDLARAVAWTHRHIAEYGGRTDQLFLVGHSAGGHLVSLLATDESYLRAEGLRTADIRGIIAVSGVYRVPAGKMAVTLGGLAPDAFHLDEVLPLRGAGGWGLLRRLGLPGIPLDVDVFAQAFGDDPDVRDSASPLLHVRPGLPPFLILHAGCDLPALPEMAAEFHAALANQGVETTLLRIDDRNHNSILFRAIEPSDPAAGAMLDFIRRHASSVRDGGR
jgi:acetyl esterase/lipase